MVKAPVFVKANRNPEMFFVSILVIAICLEVALCWMLAPGGQFRCTPVPSSTSAVAPGISLASCCHSTRVRFSLRPKLRLSDFLVISDALWLPQQSQTPVFRYLNCALASSHFPLRLATDVCLFCMCSGSSTKKDCPSSTIVGILAVCCLWTKLGKREGRGESRVHCLEKKVLLWCSEHQHGWVCLPTRLWPDSTYSCSSSSSSQSLCTSHSCTLFLWVPPSAQPHYLSFCSLTAPASMACGGSLQNLVASQPSWRRPGVNQGVWWGGMGLGHLYRSTWVRGGGTLSIAVLLWVGQKAFPVPRSGQVHLLFLENKHPILFVQLQS